MGMLCSTEVYDAMLTHISSNTESMMVCATQPSTYHHASSSDIAGTSNYVLAFTKTSSGHWEIADSTASGRAIESTQYASLTVSTSGTAAHVALVNATSSKLLYVTTCGSKALTTADTVTIPAWKIHILQPTSST